MKSKRRQDGRGCLYQDTRVICLNGLVTIILDVAESKSVENASIPRAGIQECHGGQKLQSAGRPDALPT